MNAQVATTEKSRPANGYAADAAAVNAGEKLGDSIRRVLYIVVTFSLVCFVTLMSPDATIVPANGALVFPYVETTVNVVGFIIFGPVVLLGLSIYLHVLYTRFISLRDHAPGIYVFSISRVDARIVSEFLFYWLVPIILCLFFWKMLPRPESRALAIVAAGSIAGFATLRFIRSTSRWRRMVVAGSMGFILLAVGAVSIPPIWDFGRSRLLNLRSVDFSRAKLDDKDMEAVDLRWATMEDAHVSNSAMGRANLSGSFLPHARFENTNLRGATLSKIRARGLILMHVKMEDAELPKALLQESVMEDVTATVANLAGATLTGAKLTQVDLTEAKLEEAGLARATFVNVDLTSAKMDGVILNNANMRGVNLYHASLIDAHALKADFLAANLLNANLQKADLQLADFTSANLRGTILANALLIDADLRLANLRGADLSGANLAGADLWKADIRGAKGLACNDLMTAKNWRHAVRDDALAC